VGFRAAMASGFGNRKFNAAPASDQLFCGRASVGFQDEGLIF